MAVNAIDPRDESPEADARRNSATVASFNGATFLATLEVEPGGPRPDGNGRYRDKNVIGKISGIIASGAGGKWSVENLAPIVNHTLDVFGPDRVVFGGDWPVCTLAATFRQWVEALRAIVADRPLEERRKLFHDNAVKFYRLT